MKLKILIIIGVVILTLISIRFISKDESERVCIGNNCFNVEVVDNPQTREKGLMFRESLDLDNGMLFIFENEGNYSFWMKNTLIPLDMIWIDSSGRIIDIKEADPCKFDPCTIYSHAGYAKYVLEINKGVSKNLGIEIGQLAKSDLIV
ncbi:DUF192 domain-containing protein [Candidatus Pacearchaeota archaeon]|nr:DUF192 domain-containing protein [Candidatus Pacearchaeota archaeon]